MWSSCLVQAEALRACCPELYQTAFTDLQPQGCTTSLGTLCQRSITLTAREFSWCSDRTSSVSVCASGPVTGNSLNSILFVPSLQLFTNIDEIPPESSPLKAEESQLYCLSLFPLLIFVALHFHRGKTHIQMHTASQMHTKASQSPQDTG